MRIAIASDSHLSPRGIVMLDLEPQGPVRPLFIEPEGLEQLTMYDDFPDPYAHYSWPGFAARLGSSATLLPAARLHHGMDMAAG